MLGNVTTRQETSSSRWYWWKLYTLQLSVSHQPKRSLMAGGLSSGLNAYLHIPNRRPSTDGYRKMRKVGLATTLANFIGGVLVLAWGCCVAFDGVRMTDQLGTQRRSNFEFKYDLVHHGYHFSPTKDGDFEVDRLRVGLWLGILVRWRHKFLALDDFQIFLSQNYTKVGFELLNSAQRKGAGNTKDTANSLLLLAVSRFTWSSGSYA